MIVRPPHLLKNSSCLLALDGRHDPARVPRRPELEVPDTLPRARRELAVLDRDGDARADQGALDVRLRVWQMCQSVNQSSGRLVN